MRSSSEPIADRREVFGLQLARPSGDLRVAEAVEGEGRLEHVVAAAQDVAVGGERGAQRARAELAVLQHLGVLDRDLGALRAVHRDADPADEVLAEVDQRLARRRGGDLLDGSSFQRVTRGPTYGASFAVSKSSACTPVQVVGRESGTQPGVVAQAGVDGLAVVEVVREHRARAGGPAVVGDDDLGRPVFEGDLELREGAELVAVERAAARPAETPAEPAVAEREAEDARRLEQAGDVVGRVAEAPLVAAPAGSQQVVRDRAAVQPGLDDALGAEAEGRARDGAVALLEGELAAQQRCPVEVVVGGDHAGLPVH